MQDCTRQDDTYIDRNPARDDFPFPLICPSCYKEELEKDDRSLTMSLICPHCGKQFEYEHNVANLVIGERFQDESDDECLCYEEHSNEYTSQHYWIPFFKKIQKNYSHPLNILAIGCGIGTEVDMLCDAGFNCVGIDNGNRSKIWPGRKHKERFLLANGMHLPFHDKTFDVVFCGCVFPHVGVIGDSIEVTSHYKKDRLALAAEMSRVVDSGGTIVVGSPNKKFPFDIFHGREAGSYKPHYNKPGEKFLLAAEDYRDMFLQVGCQPALAQPVEGYWGFVRSKSSLKGLLLSLPIRFMFWMVSRSLFRFLRTSVFSPWIIMATKKL